MKSLERIKAIEFRKQGKTYNEILKEVPVAKSTLTLWLRDVGLSKPQKQIISDKRIAARLRGAATRRRKRLDEVDTELRIGESDICLLTERELWLIGIALYWAEGNKQKPHNPSEGVAFCSTDYRMHRIFLDWLKLLGIPVSKLIFDLYIHENRFSEKEEFAHWWSNRLEIPLEDVCRVYKKPGNPKTNRHNTQDLYHGLLRIKVRESITLNRRIDGWVSGIALHADIADFAGSSNGRTLLFGGSYLGPNPSPAAIDS